MEDLIIWIFAGLLVFFQILTCIFARKAWLRWLPFELSIAVAVFCLIAYVGSDRTNWAYIVLIALDGMVLLLQGLILLINRVSRWIIKS